MYGAERFRTAQPRRRPGYLRVRGQVPWPERPSRSTARDQEGLPQWERRDPADLRVLRSNRDGEENDALPLQREAEEAAEAYSAAEAKRIDSEAEAASATAAAAEKPDDPILADKAAKAKAAFENATAEAVVAKVDAMRAQEVAIEAEAAAAKDRKSVV